MLFKKKEEGFLSNTFGTQLGNIQVRWYKEDSTVKERNERDQLLKDIPDDQDLSREAIIFKKCFKNSLNKNYKN